MEVSDQEQLLRLVRSLTERTNTGQLHWRRTGDPSSYIVALRTGGVMISSRAGSGQPPYELLVLDVQGNEIAHNDDFGGSTDLEESLEQLYQSVLMRVPLARPAIDALLRELEAASA